MGSDGDKKWPVVDNESELPEQLRSTPKNLLFWGTPTAWLLGARLFWSLRDIILSAFYDFEPRDWMNPGPSVDLTDEKEHAPDGAMWIDFLSDTGDSPRLVYQLAYLLQRRDIEVPCIANDKVAMQKLPRGRVMIFGGDTGYPVADEATLVARVRAPMLWAHARLFKEGTADTHPVPIYGVPGNHDYYNALGGYVQQFRKSLDRTTFQGGFAARPHTRMDVTTMTTAQEASYFALRLPFGWQLWGLDVERNQLDERQRQYFRTVKGEYPSNARIIVTSQPAFVYHDKSGRHDELVKVYEALSIAHPFSAGGALPACEVQLDLSGDVHTYERYWGKDAADLEKVSPRPKTAGEGFNASEQSNYASVVSGLGGAFHHPAQVRKGTTQPRRAWPPTAESAVAIGEVLIRPLQMLRAGAVGTVGAIIAITCCGLLWASGQRDRAMSPLDILFHSPGGGADYTVLRNLLLMTAKVSIVSAACLIIYKLFASRKYFISPESYKAKLPDSLGRGLAAWSGFWRRIIYSDYAVVCLRFIGAGRRPLFTHLSALPSTLFVAGTVVGTIYLLRLSCLAGEADAFLLLHIVVNLVVLGMGALGCCVSGKGIAKRLSIGLLGVITGALLLWTPYTWTLLFTRGSLAIAAGGGLVGAWLLLYLLKINGPSPKLTFLEGSMTSRRVWMMVIFVLLALFYTAFPFLVLHLFPEAHVSLPLPWWSAIVAFALGGYFACRWAGMYFLVSLQWNAHGNEAGSAARVDKFAEFMRIKLTPGKAEVWVLAAKGEEKERAHWNSASALDITAHLIDHFVVERDPSVACYDDCLRNTG